MDREFALFSFLKPRKEQIYIQTWHGIPLKKICNDILQDREKEKKLWIKEASYWNYLLVASDIEKRIMQNAFKLNPNIIIKTGHPRNDIFFDEEGIKKNSENIKEKFKIKDKKILLYAPTFRDGEKVELKLNLENLKKNLSDEYIILLKLYPNIYNKSNLYFKCDNDFSYDFSNYNDMQDLLAISDVLITDYSSSFFDFVLTKRPIIFYPYDFDNYKNNLRGFYFDYNQFVPGYIVTSQEDLINLIKNYNNLYNKYQIDFYEKLIEFRKKFHEKNDGEASNRIIKMLLSN